MSNTNSPRKLRKTTIRRLNFEISQKLLNYEKQLELAPIDMKNEWAHRIAGLLNFKSTIGAY